MLKPTSKCRLPVAVPLPTYLYQVTISYRGPFECAENGWATNIFGVNIKIYHIYVHIALGEKQRTMMVHTLPCNWIPIFGTKYRLHPNEGGAFIVYCLQIWWKMWWIILTMWMLRWTIVLADNLYQKEIQLQRTSFPISSKCFVRNSSIYILAAFNSSIDFTIPFKYSMFSFDMWECVIAQPFCLIQHSEIIVNQIKNCNEVFPNHKSGAGSFYSFSQE